MRVRGSHLRERPAWRVQPESQVPGLLEQALPAPQELRGPDRLVRALQERRVLRGPQESQAPKPVQRA